MKLTKEQLQKNARLAHTIAVLWKGVAKDFEKSAKNI